jgi:hypothetical protein
VTDKTVALAQIFLSFDIGRPECLCAGFLWRLEGTTNSSQEESASQLAAMQAQVDHCQRERVLSQQVGLWHSFVAYGRRAVGEDMIEKRGGIQHG